MTIDGNVALVIVAVIAAVGSIITTLITVSNRSKLEVIHVLVNSNLAKVKQDLLEALIAKSVSDAEVKRLREDAAVHAALAHPEVPA